MWSCRTHFDRTEEGQPLVSVLAKGTFRILADGECETASEALPFVEQDSLFGADPANSAIRQEMDVVGWKPRTDLIVQGKCFAPRGKQGLHFDVGAKVGDRIFRLRVFGARKIDASRGSIRFTDPEPFESMPVHWGLAYGGVDSWTKEAHDLIHPANPVGIGFWVKPSLERIHGALLPNLEDPDQPLTPETFLVQSHDRWPRMPQPKAMGWAPRSAGHRLFSALEKPSPEQLPWSSASGLPPFQGRSARNGAHPGLQFSRLREGQAIDLFYFHPDRLQWSIRLPKQRPNLRLDLGKGSFRLPCVLDTIEIFPAVDLVTVVWRGTKSLPREALPEDFASARGSVQQD